MNTVEILREAKALISDRTHWTKGENARYQNGTEARPTDPTACCWCAGGAVMKVTDEDFFVYNRAFNFLNQAARELNYARATGGDEADFVNFNDDEATDHAGVLAMFDRAVERAEAVTLVNKKFVE